MRRVRYQVATSLDGFIADANDGYGWISEEPQFDFAELFAQFDTLLMGRRTFEIVADQLEQFTDKDIFVFSSNLKQTDYPGVTVVRGRAGELVRELKHRPGKDIWLYGGGILFRDLLQQGLVDTVELAVMPVLLGDGIKVLPGVSSPAHLQLASIQRYDTSGMMLLNYVVK